MTQSCYFISALIAGTAILSIQVVYAQPVPQASENQENIIDIEPFDPEPIKVFPPTQAQPLSVPPKSSEKPSRPLIEYPTTPKDSVQSSTPKPTQSAPSPTQEKPTRPTSNSPASAQVIEGELVSVGQIGLLPWNNRVGLQIGIERLGEIYYSSFNLGMNHRFSIRGEPLTLTIGIPLRFELLDSRPNQRFENVGQFRSQDWDEASDYAKVIQRLSIGSKEGRFYLDINRFASHTLGHGLIMKRYDANLNFNTSRVGVQLDAFSDYLGFESTLNDIVNPNVIGALIFIKPLSIINRQHYLTRSFSIGVTGVTDLRAPVRNVLDYNDVDNDGRRASELQLDQQTFRPESLTARVNAYGIDAEIKLVDKRGFDLKTYLDYSVLDSSLPVGDPESIDPNIVGLQRVRSTGFAWGHLIRSNLGVDPIHALRFRIEYRNYEPNYLPNYFDSLYEVQSLQYLPSGADTTDLANATKLQRIFSRDVQQDRVHGAYFEANWRIGNGFAFAMGLEVNDQSPDNHAFIHFEIPRAGNWQVSSTYHRRNAANGSDLFDLSFHPNDIWMFQTRHQTFSWLNTNFSVMTPFGFGPTSVFRNAVQVNLSLEFGFNYGKKESVSSQPASPVSQPRSKTPAQPSGDLR